MHGTFKIKQMQAAKRSKTTCLFITFTLNHLADAFIQNKENKEAIRPLREQQYTSVMTSLS